MTTSKRRDAIIELENIETALIQSILDASGKELYEEIKCTGENPEYYISIVEECLEIVRSNLGKSQLDEARAKLMDWRKESGNVTDLERERAQKKLYTVRQGDHELDSKITLAARKGEGLSDSDMEGILTDIAELERFEEEDGDE